ncbi:MAG: NTF2 fold immunity protein [Pseudomonadota bacterium]|nr:NTF2 fold immunity protein [Pseudomonadota bacterium]
MSDITYPTCNYNEPTSVLEAFIGAMNQWELLSYKLSREYRSDENPSGYFEVTNKFMEKVFSLYCTPKERPYGRNGGFSRPPQYDPLTEKITFSQAYGKKWHVETIRDHSLYGGKLLYVLQKSQGEWRVDSVKIMRGEKWCATIL